MNTLSPYTAALLTSTEDGDEIYTRYQAALADRRCRQRALYTGLWRTVTLASWRRPNLAPIPACP